MLHWLHWKGLSPGNNHTTRFKEGRLSPSGIGRSSFDVPFTSTEYIALSVNCAKCGVTSVDEDVSAKVVGASEGRRAVLADVRLVSWRQAASISIQHH